MGQSLSKFKDFFINILASILLTGMTQIFVYPMLGRYFSASEYGTILTLIGVVNAIGASLGSPLNNTKILMNSLYKHKKYEGDYNLVAIGCIIVSFFSTTIISSVVRQQFTNESIALGIITALVFYRAYYSAGYRIVINYNKVLCSNICGVIGYIVGIILLNITGKWYWIFLCGEAFSCVYITFTSNIVKSPIKRTPLFGKMLERFGCYFVANSFSYGISYMDRFFLYPILGAESVSMYTTASILGKVAGIIMTPISGVLLTYYCKEDNLTIKQFKKRMNIYFVLSIIAYLGIVILGYPILKILYPTLAPMARPYFYVANLGSIVLLLGDTIMPTLLRYAKPFWAPTVQGIFASCYIIVGFIGMKLVGLSGFCYAVLAVNTIRVAILLVVSFVTIKKLNIKEIKND